MIIWINSETPRSVIIFYITSKNLIEPFLLVSGSLYSSYSRLGTLMLTLQDIYTPKSVIIETIDITILLLVISGEMLTMISIALIEVIAAMRIFLLKRIGSPYLI
jgi:hypothetical protein